MKKYYRIKCIEKNIKYHGSNFWDAGYSYSYTPVSAGHKYMFEVLDNFNERQKYSWNKLRINVVRNFKQTQCVITIKGRKRCIEDFISKLLQTEFSDYFEFKQCSYWNIDYEHLF